MPTFFSAFVHIYFLINGVELIRTFFPQLIFIFIAPIFPKYQNFLSNSHQEKKFNLPNFPNLFFVRKNTQTYVSLLLIMSVRVRLSQPFCNFRNRIWIYPEGSGLKRTIYNPAHDFVGVLITVNKVRSKQHFTFSLDHYFS